VRAIPSAKVPCKPPQAARSPKERRYHRRSGCSARQSECACSFLHDSMHLPDRRGRRWETTRTPQRSPLPKGQYRDAEDTSRRLRPPAKPRLARDILPPSGLTSIKPDISSLSVWIPAGPLALSSTSLALEFGCFADSACTACTVRGMSMRSRTWSSRNRLDPSLACTWLTTKSDVLRSLKAQS
jgi:hypothetical protein